MWKSASVGVYQLLNWKMHGETLKYDMTISLNMHPLTGLWYLLGSVRDCNTDKIIFSSPCHLLLPSSILFLTTTDDKKFGRVVLVVNSRPTQFVQQNHSWEPSSCSATQGIPQNKIWNFIATSTGVRRCAMASASSLHSTPPPVTVFPSPPLIFLSVSMCAHSCYKVRKVCCGRFFQLSARR